MRILFVRHGQTEDNVQGIIQGQKDTPLNDYGRFESRRLAQKLAEYSIWEAWSSPLSRAKETAEIVVHHQANSVVVQTDDSLKERGLGSIEGRRRKKGEKSPKDAETFDSLALRSIAWFDDFLQSHEPYSPLPQHLKSLWRLFDQTSPRSRSQEKEEKTSLVVSHGAWLGTFLSILLSPVYNFKLARGVDLGVRCANTSIMSVHCHWDDGKWRGTICGWGDIEHLADMIKYEVKEVADDVR